MAQALQPPLSALGSSSRISHSSPSPTRSTRIKRRSESTESKENLQPNGHTTFPDIDLPRKSRGMSESRDSLNTNGFRHSSLDPEERDPDQTVRARKNPNRSVPVGSKSSYNGLPTLSPIPANPDVMVDAKKVPPPSISAGSGPSGTVRPMNRQRSSSIKRKPSPGVTPTKVVDWEIPRKTLHSSIGVLSLLQDGSGLT
jgi:diacylglycerol kinase (CTP)